MPFSRDVRPDETAARTALWRALHRAIDPPPHVLEDELGLKLLNPGPDWLKRGDMDPGFTRPFRASIVARARFIEDLAIDRAKQGLSQYVILGAGLDTFAQRNPEIGALLDVFEIDQLGTQQWKQNRLTELGFPVPDWLHFVPVDFEQGRSWWDSLMTAGFDPTKATLVVSTGVSMYLTHAANELTLRQAAGLPPGSTFAMTFLVPTELADPVVRPGLEMAVRAATASDTPFRSFYTPEDILALAHKAGFRRAQHVSGDELANRYFAHRKDGLRPPNNAEELLVAHT
ncbi:class I SAM-dependent methyltransferase [Rhizobium sp. P44RR-XXIV]|uniref:class I SAM-dependent methyltransferase n=1 Tax=Rhizobium sp. P44RR-XXIV TaxID=1921145 RepID=UPI00098748C5|nr:class I SAM-dependent methyltransferase [Rhizobium sp. P44RR-XXIV]TIX88092.1 SAM-dependent methyltransferase [Rhizobium sp. P44RR-XXIV]